MARSGVNKVIILGNLGNDPELKYMPNGDAVANISVATSESWKDKNTGEQREKTEWHRIVMFRRLAEIVGEYLRKGSKVYIEGKLQTRKWQGQDGTDRYTTEIVADQLQMLGSKLEDNSNYQKPRQQTAQTQQSTGPIRSPLARDQPAQQSVQTESNPFDDDIPFN